MRLFCPTCPERGDLRRQEGDECVYEEGELVPLSPFRARAKGDGKKASRGALGLAFPE